MPDSTPLLLLLAHPDDEFAAFPLVAASAGNVHVAWLTDGGWGGQCVERRRRESIETLARMGVLHERMHFLGHEWTIPDGALYLRLDDVVPRLVAHFDRLIRNGRLAMPAWEGGHSDHDACHLAGLALSRSLGLEARQFSLYHGAGLPGPVFKVLAPLAANGPPDIVPTTLPQRIGYAARCLGYRSQWKSFVGLLPFYAWRMRRRDAFVLQPVSAARTAERPHPGFLLYERRGGPSWDAWAAATAAYRWPFASGPAPRIG